MEENIISYVMPFIFLGIPLVSLVVFCAYRYVRDHKRCTAEVLAVCVDVEVFRKKTRNGHRTLYRPIWRFEYEGMYYTLNNDMGSNFIIPSTGDEKTFFVNPQNPTEFRPKSDLRYILVGGPAAIILIVVTLLILIP